MDLAGRRRPHQMRHVIGAAHIWLGLTLGLVWSLQGLTGAMLVFHRELDRLTLATPRPAVPLPLDRLIAATQQQLPAQAEAIGVIDADPSILSVSYEDSAGGRRSLLIDSATGTVLRERNWRPTSLTGGNFTRWIYNLHHQLLLGESGGFLLGASGLLLFLSAGWGLYLAWPRRDHWGRVFAFRNWRSRLQRLFGWHRATGLCATIALFLLALSGASMDFGKQLRTFGENHLGYKRPFTVKPAQPPEHRIGADSALAIARARLPGAMFVALTLPSPKMPAYQVRFRQPGEWRRWSGTTMVTIDPRQGDVLDIYDATKAPLANRLLESAFAVHSGEVAGFTGRAIVMLAGLSLPALYATGIWAWLRKRRLRRGTAHHFGSESRRYP